MDSLHGTEWRDGRIKKHMPEFETESGMINDDTRRKRSILSYQNSFWKNVELC